MANWKEYTTKTTPEDADEIMIADYKANVSKRTPFSGLWNWIANKLATAVISQLETQNKSIIPALNELNSKLIPKRLSISYNEGFSGNIVAIQYGKVLHISGYVTSEQSGSQLTAALIPGVQLFANGFQLIFQTDDKKICTFGTLTKDGSIIIGPCEKNVYRFNAAAFIK